MLFKKKSETTYVQTSDSNKPVVGGMSQTKTSSKLVESIKKLPRKWLMLSIGVLLLIILGGVLLAVNSQKDSPKQEKQTAPVPGLLSDPAVLSDADRFVALRKQEISRTNASDSSKLQLRVETANFYANSFKYEKQLAELLLIKSELPAAEKDLFYLSSLFSVQKRLGHEAEAKAVAKQFVGVGKEATSFGLVPTHVLKEIEAYAK